MNFKNIFYGTLGSLLGYFFFISLFALVSGSNVSTYINPSSFFKTYLFGFVWTMGYLGACIGIAIVLVFLGSFYLLGVWVYRKLSQRQP